MRLVLPYPPSANTYWKPARGRGLVPSDEANAYKAQVARVAAVARVQPLFGRVHLTLTVYRPRRIGDLDNSLKVLNDALNGVAWLDDDQVVHIHADRADDADNPRVELHATAERFATREEADAHRDAKAERARKARLTRNRNRAERRRNHVRVTPGLRLPTRRDTP
ncbi:RusA family crossover junction endodeoxyribonuclease [Pyxidicoccus parkwayensis]|uniref:RusA family crossover junction endodeoxyribonuclease n=1 Tax=Pyxidicoccus parkwayensis TaxID=2813578 RepID=A0ABX7P307_9BACT|nr:RusA family crossover junction endodeoxyribonuclease [Pyxidicoccus parkwaysis]QSQ24843.1 RusA family crossover junction endodeoxyribonuclease [Pyxidicoccus parkwaysis]